MKEFGISAIEQHNAEKLQRFRDKVTSQLCAFFSNQQDIKLAVFETLPQFSDSISAGGWVKASEVTPSEDVAKQLTRLLDENEKLRLESEGLQNKLAKASAGTPNFQQLAKTLRNENITIPADIAGTDQPVERNLLDLAVGWSDELALGVSNQLKVSNRESFIFFNVASRLAAFGLAEHAQVPRDAMWQRLKLSKEGIRLVTQTKLLVASQKEKKGGGEKPNDIFLSEEQGVTTGPKQSSKSTLTKKKKE